MDTNTNLKLALTWLVELLNDSQVPYQIVGGTAASIHGGERPVEDIDLYIHRDDYQKIAGVITPYLSKPMRHSLEAGWDVEYCQLIYSEQKIEIGLAPGTRIFHRQTRQWLPLEIDFGSSEQRNYLGVEVSVMPVAALVEYKAALDRPMDRIDIEEIS
ncbi:MazG-related protein [Vibrio sp. SCSIO 43136]|uniref:MazG-related protein n=1 Tax=Vibrio sp. SCSIO 43136 TaxID=2819101 RepID=UPI002075E073|nr:MazG-related protein [Vibrio sp. SCSIO 43136]USD67077.1 MazG-related protein [Vibrio sp. SCSIO 43136]